MMTRGSSQGAVEESGTKRKRNVPTPRDSPLKSVVPVAPIVTNVGKKSIDGKDEDSSVISEVFSPFFNIIKEN